MGGSATATASGHRGGYCRGLCICCSGDARLWIRGPMNAKPEHRTSLAQARRARLLAAMDEAGVGGVVLYGNAWQGDYLRYGADFGILEGHGIAVLSAEGTLDLFVDSAAEAERAEAETAGTTVHFASDIARA